MSLGVDLQSNTLGQPGRDERDGTVQIHVGFLYENVPHTQDEFLSAH